MRLKERKMDKKGYVSFLSLLDAKASKHAPLSTILVPGSLLSVHNALQEWLPSRDNVVFLIDAQAAMFECADLRDTPVRGSAPAASLFLESRLAHQAVNQLCCKLVPFLFIRMICLIP